MADRLTYYSLPQIDQAVADFAAGLNPAATVDFELVDTLQGILGNGPDGAAGIERLRAIIDRALYSYAGYTRAEGFTESEDHSGEAPWLDCCDLEVAEERHNTAATEAACAEWKNAEDHL